MKAVFLSRGNGTRHQPLTDKMLDKYTRQRHYRHAAKMNRKVAAADYAVSINKKYLDLKIT